MKFKGRGRKDHIKGFILRAGGNIDGESGVIMADALIGVVIVSLMIAVCLATLKITRAFLRTDRDSRQALLVLEAVMEAVPRAAGHYAGTSGTASYVVDVTEEPDRGVRLCRMNAFVRVQNHDRAYRLSGTRWCARASA